jgi:uncharacterized RDD family membrane protein YckC
MPTPEIEFQYRTLADRVGAYILDGLFLIPLMFGINYLLMGNAETGPQFVVDVLATLTWGLYMIIAQAWFGTTLGKKILNLKVIKLEKPEAIGFKKAVTRELIWIVPYFIVFLVYVLFNDPMKNIDFMDSLDYNLYLMIVSVLGMIVKFISVSRDPMRRGIHDKWSGSVVVRKAL